MWGGREDPMPFRQLSRGEGHNTGSSSGVNNKKGKKEEIQLLLLNRKRVGERRSVGLAAGEGKGRYT